MVFQRPEWYQALPWFGCGLLRVREYSRSGERRSRVAPDGHAFRRGISIPSNPGLMDPCCQQAHPILYLKRLPPLC
jgi:hypothetical protein